MPLKPQLAWASGRARQWTAGAWRALCDLTFPPRCVLCEAEMAGQGDGDLLICPPCQSGLAPAGWPSCPRCGAGVSEHSLAAAECAECHGRRFGFDSVLPLGPYEGALRQAVLRTKRQRGEHLAVGLARLAARQLADRVSAIPSDVVVPVPMHWQRRIARGTNGPDVLSVELAGRRGLPADHRMLRQWRKTLPQKDLPQTERFRNVRGAFRVRGGYDLRGARILLVDDILTSGATCSEAAGTLKKAGAARVDVVVWARASAIEPA
jgi:ComF family protein